MYGIVRCEDEDQDPLDYSIPGKQKACFYFQYPGIDSAEHILVACQSLTTDLGVPAKIQFFCQALYPVDRIQKS